MNAEPSLQIACPHCNAINRVPAARRADAPQCGRCRQALFTAHPLVIGSDAMFQAHAAKGDLPLLVDFWAPWCGPCRMVGPILDKIAKEYDGKLTVAKVNTDEHNQWAMKYGVQGIPTMLFVADGKLVHKQVGALPEPVLKDLVNQFLEVTATVEKQAG